MNIRKFTPKTASGSRGAFTLIEVLIVVGIIALLMGITTQMMGTVASSQGRAKAKTDMAFIVSGLEAFSSQYGGYPRLNATSDAKKVAGDLYKCLCGKMILRVSEGQLMMSDVGENRKPFLDASKLRVTDPVDPLLDVVDPEKNGVFFGDPWAEPYLYYYDTTAYMTNEGNTSWHNPSFLLLTKGQDTKTKEVGNMYTTGIMPNDDEYREPEENIDDIIYGRDD